MERIVPDVTEALLYSKRTAVASWGIDVLNVIPVTSSAVVWANSSTLTVTVVMVLCAKVASSMGIDL